MKPLMQGLAPAEHSPGVAVAVAIASPLYFIAGEMEAPSERKHSLSIRPRELVNKFF